LKTSASSKPSFATRRNKQRRPLKRIPTDINPGEISLADLAEPMPHPEIIVSREAFNRAARDVVVLCTSQKFAPRATLPHCLPSEAGQFGFSKDCVAKCENIFLVSKDDLDPNPIGMLSDVILRDIIKAVGHVIDADCEPN